MAKIYDVNRIAVHGGATNVFYLKQILVSASWVVSASSDGTTFFPSSDGITTDSSGSGGMNNPFAWFAIRDPANNRMITFQRSGTSASLGGSQHWRIATVNTGSNIYPVTGANETTAFEITPANKNDAGYTVAVGSGSMISPLFERMFETTGSFRCHTIAMDTPYNGVYPWYNFNSTASSLTGRTTSLWHQEPFITGSTTGTSPLVHRFQFCSLATYGFGTALSTDYSYYSAPRAVAGINGSCYVGMPNMAQSSSINTTANLYNAAGTLTTIQLNNMPLNLDGTDYMHIPFYLASSQVDAKYKLIQGHSRYIRIGSRALYAAAGHYYPDVTNITTDAYVFSGPLLIPWPENVFPTS